MKILSISANTSIRSIVRRHHMFTTTKTQMVLDPFEARVICFARKKNGKNVIKDRELRKSMSPESSNSLEDKIKANEISEFGEGYDINVIRIKVNNRLGEVKSVGVASRGAVLQSCTVTSGLILALGSMIRQASHIAFSEGWTTHDFSSEVSFNFEIWHLELIIGLVFLISSCRYLLLQIWPNFAESSEAANQQVLSALQPLDYMFVAFLPGISEELLFRGALLPLFGINWKSAVLVAAIFGVLHLGGGRKYSFAVWGTFVGLLYGYATILSSSIIVPITAHALNNLVGGILWRYLPTLSSQEK